MLRDMIGQSDVAVMRQLAPQEGEELGFEPPSGHVDAMRRDQACIAAVAQGQPSLKDRLQLLRESDRATPGNRQQVAADVVMVRCESITFGASPDRISLRGFVPL
jgi:hypothetical protein